MKYIIFVAICNLAKLEMDIDGYLTRKLNDKRDDFFLYISIVNFPC